MWQWRPWCLDFWKVILTAITLIVLLCSLLIFHLHRNMSSTCYVEEVMDLRWKSLHCKPSFPLIPVFLLQEACPKLSQNEASPIQRAL